MGFRINTNIAAMNAHTNATQTNRGLDKSLAALSSGLRINTAADDSSGMVIADSLRSQANSLGQAIANANDGISVIQTADKAMDEQLKILDTIKTKAIQAASDTQNAASREAIQKDVNRLIEQLDNIAKTTSFNGQILLSGQFTNKEFQVGAYSNQTIQASINNTQSLATGNMQTKSDIVELGNYESFALGATITKDSTSLQISTALVNLDVTGLAVGDKIRIEGQGDFTIVGFSGGAELTTGTALSAGNLILDRGLDKTVTSGDTLNISIVDEAADDLSKVLGTTELLSTAADTTGLVLSASDLTGFALGDAIFVTNSAGSTVSASIVGISYGGGANASGTIILSASTAITGTMANASFEIVDRAGLGTNFTSSDFIQYTVEGTTLTGVQLTDDNGNGVANTGLGRVADMINATTEETGVKAVAVVEKNSLLKVAETQILSDISINGITILEAGTSINAGDSDGTLVDAINSKSDVTGVTAAVEADGSLTLISDGRAMNVSGLSAVAGITDGVITGRIEFTKPGSSTIDVSSAHFQEQGLVNSTSNVLTLGELETKHNLSDVVVGQVDSNGDGTIDENDKVGLMQTQDGAMLAMDIVESAISELDGIRADLGAVQNQLVVTVNNISVTQVNVKAAESQIRDVDFAAESANFSRLNILAQSGSYAMSQANAVQQNVLRLLQ